MRERERERLDQRQSLISYYTSAIPFTCKKKKRLLKWRKRKCRFSERDKQRRTKEGVGGR